MRLGQAGSCAGKSVAASGLSSSSLLALQEQAEAEDDQQDGPVTADIQIEQEVEGDGRDEKSAGQRAARCAPPAAGGSILAVGARKAAHSGNENEERPPVFEHLEAEEIACQEENPQGNQNQPNKQAAALCFRLGYDCPPLLFFQLI